MPHRITQSYLPPDRDDIRAYTPAEAGTRLSDPAGMQGWVDLVGLLHTEMVYPPEDAVTHPSTNWAWRALTSFMRRTLLTNTPHCRYRNWTEMKLTDRLQHSEGGGGVRFIPAWFLYFFVLYCIAYFFHSLQIECRGQIMIITGVKVGRH